MINVIYQFTYKNYIECIHNIKQREYLELKEDDEKYVALKVNNLNTGYTDITENLFRDKERICIFLNCFLDCYEKIEKQKLIYKEITVRKNSIKIVYKHSDRQIFYVIIHQKEISINLPYFILQECINIIQKCKQKNIKNIIIIPIVIYIEENKYSYGKTMKHCFQITTYDNNILELKYNLINLLKISKQPKMKNTIIEELIYII